MPTPKRESSAIHVTIDPELKAWIRREFPVRGAETMIVRRVLAEFRTLCEDTQAVKSLIRAAIYKALMPERIGKLARERAQSLIDEEVSNIPAEDFDEPALDEKDRASVERFV